MEGLCMLLLGARLRGDFLGWILGRSSLQKGL